MAVLEIGGSHVETGFVTNLDGLCGEAQCAGARIFIRHGVKIHSHPRRVKQAPAESLPLRMQQITAGAQAEAQSGFFATPTSAGRSRRSRII
jgi:hypothetical protein